jgi:hypothetical protein
MSGGQQLPVRFENGYAVAPSMPSHRLDTDHDLYQLELFRPVMIWDSPQRSENPFLDHVFRLP